ncbi:uncharacterized protein EV420DRAFT_1709868 [Desarmillaria tabescens]|uniref:Splicing arginine serine-rich 12 n=1 Tax=Armillaria tabescens TaxID=1929756 RepID=A0AA39NI80_ARMTA|nr:uncharacterized protein EV420DRAFT_1709868 [Desarmillaria tabescens]KAK0466097.1 hypothetical protein EV420DRAFT_1709868 [Desarmillaria tabescens]
MTSRRSRSRSRSPGRSRRRERSRSYSEDEERRLPHNASPISESDYFQKSDEFRIWLKDEKGKYFDELSGERARSYFRKFVKAWNRGKLSSKYVPTIPADIQLTPVSEKLYAGVDSSSIPATSQTSYKWSFASKSDGEALRAARESVGVATQSRALPESSGAGRVQGPTLPSAADLVLAREMDAEHRDEERKYKRKRERAEDKDRIEEMVGPREVGREGMLEKKRARREADKSFREKGDDAVELDESALFGGDSFQARIARRDAGKKRYQQAQEEKAAAMRERATAIKEKESATMSMFQQLAKQRFG